MGFKSASDRDHGKPLAGNSTPIQLELTAVGARADCRYQKTVKAILKEHKIDPGPNRGQGTWDEFLKIHADTLWQCDVVFKPMWTVKGLVDLYFLVFLHLGTRRCWISPCTVTPDSSWVSRQAKNFLMAAEDWQLAPKIVIRDNDAKYSQQFDDDFKTSGVTVMRNKP